MSWFGGGKSSSGSNSGSGGGSSSDSSHVFDDSSSLSLGSSGLGGGGGGGGSMAEFQQMAAMIQQQVVVQGVISELTDSAFHKCCTSHKDVNLTGREMACISAVTNKYLDANEYLTRRLGRKMQQQQGAGSPQF
jgi:Tim10/DDP family zinc finger